MPPKFFLDKKMEFKQNNKTVLEVLTDGTIIIEDGQQQIFFDTEEDKPTFPNEKTGELVLEYTGKVADGRADRSWAKAIFAAKNGYSPAHHHAERIEIYYITKGKLKVIIDEVEHILLPGDQITIQPKQIHQVFNLDDKASELIVYCSPAWIPEDFHLVAVEQPSAGLQSTYR